MMGSIIRHNDSGRDYPNRPRLTHITDRTVTSRSIMAETLAKSSQQSPVFIARGLAKTYLMGEVEVHALRGVDLEIHEGEFIVLLGPSGSDKSTLLNILGELDTATSGEVFWRDHNLTRADEAALTAYRREHIGFVFQFYNLIPSLTVKNIGDHLDHVTAGRIAVTAVSPGFRKGYSQALFLGYHLLNQPENLTQAPHDQKLGFFGAYYFTVLDIHGRGETELCAGPLNERDYAAALWRQSLTQAQ